MKKKEKIFSRLSLNTKNYNEELEIILDKKGFNEETQNLILSIFYKIENAYTDYHSVKKQTPSKEVFIQNIISVINKYCNQIEIIKPKGKKSEKEYKINREKGELKCFPNESILLYAICQLIILNEKEKDLKEVAINELLEIGNSLNYQEVIRDFNGWSWADFSGSIEELQCNLVYQNLLLILGHEKLEEILLASDKMTKITEELEKIDKDLANQFVKRIYQIAILLKSNKNKEYKIKIQEFFKPLIEELEKLEDKEQLLNYITDKKKDITDKIREIDKMLNDINGLKEEFDKRNKDLPEDKRIFSISELADIYEEERKMFLEQMKECNRLVEPMVYLEKKEQLTNEVKFYEELELKEDKKSNIDKKIIELQEIFLEYFRKKIENCYEKKDIINLIYDFRYYWLINYKKNYKIKSCTKLKKILEQVLRELIDKAEELKAIEKVSNDLLCNMKIFEKILQSKIITLENIILQMNNDNEEYHIQYFDGDILEGKINLKLEEINNKKKKIKLFI